MVVLVRVVCKGNLASYLSSHKSGVLGLVLMFKASKSTSSPSQGINLNLRWQPFERRKRWKSVHLVGSGTDLACLSATCVVGSLGARGFYSSFVPFSVSLTSGDSMLNILFGKNKKSKH